MNLIFHWIPFLHRRYFYMVAIPKKFQLIKAALRKELFIQTCGPLILKRGNGTRFIRFPFLPDSSFLFVCLSSCICSYISWTIFNLKMLCKKILPDRHRIHYKMWARVLLLNCLVYIIHQKIFNIFLWSHCTYLLYCWEVGQLIWVKLKPFIHRIPRLSYFYLFVLSKSKDNITLPISQFSSSESPRAKLWNYLRWGNLLQCITF